MALAGHDDQPGQAARFAPQHRVDLVDAVREQVEGHRELDERVVVRVPDALAGERAQVLVAEAEQPEQHRRRLDARAPHLRRRASPLEIASSLPPVERDLAAAPDEEDVPGDGRREERDVGELGARTSG